MGQEMFLDVIHSYLMIIVSMYGIWLQRAVWQRFCSHFFSIWKTNMEDLVSMSIPSFTPNEKNNGYENMSTFSLSSSCGLFNRKPEPQLKSSQAFGSPFNCYNPRLIPFYSPKPTLYAVQYFRHDFHLWMSVPLRGGLIYIRLSERTTSSFVVSRRMP